jgi:nitroreductase
MRLDSSSGVFQTTPEAYLRARLERKSGVKVHAMSLTLKPAAKTVKDAIESRRSIRQFEQTPMNEADLLEILRLSSLAQSAFNMQPWRFVVVTNPEIKAKLELAANGQKQVGSAPVVIAVIADGVAFLEPVELLARPEVASDPEKFEKFKGSVARAYGAKTIEQNIAIGYLTLAARGLGYDTSVMLGFKPSEVKQLLEIPEHAQVTALIALGQGTEEGLGHHRLPLEVLARFVR